MVNTNFRRLWIAGLVADSGDWLMIIALPLVVLDLTGSALGTSIAFLLALAPPVVLAPLIGRMVDRLPGRAVMIIALLAQAAALTPLLVVRDDHGLPLVYGVIIVQASFGAAFEAAKNAVMPALVELDQLVSANGLMGLNNNLGRILGGSLGGILLVLIGLGGITFINIGTYVIATGIVATLSRKQAAPTAVQQNDESGQSNGGVISAIFTLRTGAPLIVTFVAAIAQGLFVLLLVFFVTDVLGGNEADVGVLRGVQAVGAITAGVSLGVLGARLDIVRLTVVSSIAFAVITTATWNLSFFTQALPPFVVLFAIIGAPAVFTSVGLTSLLQKASADKHRGSAFAALGLAQALGQAIGLLAGGLLKQPIGTMTLLQVQAGTYVLAALLAVWLLPRAGQRQGLPAR